MTQIITIFCEGPHDVAFIYRMLKSISYESYASCKIGKLPPPFNQLIANEIEKSDIKNLNLIEVRRGFLPAKVLQKEDKYIFLYSLGGDSKSQARQKMVGDILSFISEPGEISVIPEGTNFSVIYLFDSDNQGVGVRLNALNREINRSLGAKGTINFTSNGSFQIKNKINFGAFIFTGTDNDTGTLESILLPLMKEGNNTIFEAAKHYISTNHDPKRLFSLKTSIDPTTKLTIEQRGTSSRDRYKFYPSKSIIGTAGQLQRSGKSNVVCISDSDYITIDKIQRNPKCIEIVEFLNKI